MGYGSDSQALPIIMKKYYIYVEFSCESNEIYYYVIMKMRYIYIFIEYI